MKRSSKYGSNYWETYSPKIKRNVRFFSDLEYDNWILVETDSSIKSFCEQPFEISYLQNGEICKSIPDMWVQYLNNRECIIEVKYSSELVSTNKRFERTKRQISIQEAWCNENGYEYKVNTEKEIRANSILLSNMKMLFPYIKNRLHPVDIDIKKIINIINDCGRKTSIGVIEMSLIDVSPVRIRESLSWMLYQGIICGNLDRIPFSNNTEVWLRDDKAYN